MPGHFTFYHPNTDNKTIGETLLFPETEYKHAIKTLRYQIADSIEFSDGKGKIYSGKIVAIGKSDFTVNLVSEQQIKKERKLQLIVGLLHNTDRMEWLVEKATEFGVFEIIWVKMDRSEARKINLERMEKVAVAALKQCHGAYLPKISFSQDLAKVLSNLANSNKFIAHCMDNEIIDLPTELPDECTVLIGPEGDFTAKEVELSVDFGFKPVRLGNQILRAETAALYVAAKHYL